MTEINDIYNKNIIETNADVLLRILFIYSKFSTDINYVQGMNKIISSIYYF